MFIDQAIINVSAGKGGDGCVAFSRTRYTPKGGPNGGDGGRGGDVIFYADPGLNTLQDFRGVRDWKAGDGEPGRGSQQHGADAKSRVIKVPPGTLVYEINTGELLHDMEPGERWTVARGGRGGYGNEHFKSSTNQAPRRFLPGALGERHEIRLELKLIADVGLVGMPNAGKSTLLRTLTRADPKVADYPFTTLSPQLGIAELDPARRIVFADIPGLIEGAAGGAGLGHDFLRHIERTRVILHLVDGAPLDGSDPVQNYRVIRGELAGYTAALDEKPEVIALNKNDLLSSEEAEALMKRFRTELQLGVDTETITLSGATGLGVNELLEVMWNLIPARSDPTVEKNIGWSKPASRDG